ncbi:MAG: UbiD family decarboxylase [Bacteroidales bacterium]
MFGAGQMMFSKYIVVLDDEVALTDYAMVAEAVLRNAGSLQTFL